MKKINYFLLIGLIGLVGVFTSCEEDDPLGLDEDITITPGDLPDTVIIGNTVDFSFSVICDAKIQSIELKKGVEDLDLKEDNFTNNTSDNYSYSYTATEADEGEQAFRLIVTDKKDNVENFDFTVTIAPQSTPLSAASQLVLTYKSSSQTDGENISQTVGIEYASNLTATEAKFEVVATKNNVFVMLTESEANAITTKEELKTTFDANEASGVTSFTAQSDALFSAKWFATKVDGVYYWVHMTDLEFAAGNNKAYFDYKK